MFLMYKVFRRLTPVTCICIMLCWITLLVSLVQGQTLHHEGPFFFPTGETSDPIYIIFGEHNTTHFFLNMFVTGAYWFGFGFASGSTCTAQLAEANQCYMKHTEALIFGEYSISGLTAKEYILGTTASPHLPQIDSEQGYLGVGDVIQQCFGGTCDYTVRIKRPYDPNAYGDRDAYRITYPLAGSFCFLWAQGNGIFFNESDPSSSSHLNKGVKCIDLGGTTSVPTPSPSYNPIPNPTIDPTPKPTRYPSVQGDTARPTIGPTTAPTADPVNAPSVDPTQSPTPGPTVQAGVPTKSPTFKPTIAPTDEPTSIPTPEPSKSPTKRGNTRSPTREPSVQEDTAHPTAQEDTPHPTVKPTRYPSVPGDTARPTIDPTVSPTAEGDTRPPTGEPSSSPSDAPSSPAIVGIPTLCISDPLTSDQVLELKLYLDFDNDLLTIEIFGPDDQWFGVGFGEQMANTYAYIVSGENLDITEHKLAFHKEGVDVQSLKDESNVFSDSTSTEGRRYVSIVRPYVLGNRYDFTDFVNCEQDLSIIWGLGEGLDLSYHGKNGYGIVKFVSCTCPTTTVEVHSEDDAFMVGIEMRPFLVLFELFVVYICLRT
eukprot:8314_1